MRQFTHAGNQYLLGRSGHGYGIWAIGQEHAGPAAYFPPSPQGWDEAFGESQRIEPDGRLLGGPSQQQVGNPYGQLGPPSGQPNGMATAGGIVGISGAALSLIPFIGIVIGLITRVLAIIFSGVGLVWFSEFSRSSSH